MMIKNSLAENWASGAWWKVVQADCRVILSHDLIYDSLGLLIIELLVLKLVKSV